MKKGFLILLVTLFVLSTGTAFATLIDFTSQDWAGAEGQYTFSNDVDGINVSLDAWTTYNLFGWKTEDRLLTWNDGDGLGVDSKTFQEDDEISYTQYLKVDFSPNVVVNTIFALDIDEDDYVRYSLIDGVWTDGGSGIAEITVNYGSDVSSIIFTGSLDGGLFCATYSDYALAGIDVTAPVPEPTTLLLLGSGLAGLAFYRRKRTK